MILSESQQKILRRFAGFSDGGSPGVRYRCTIDALLKRGLIENYGAWWRITPKGKELMEKLS